LAAVQLAAIIYTLVLCALGVLTFCCDWWILTLIFAILLILSTVFTGAIAILALVGGSVGTLEKYVGCNSKYTGVLNAWNYIDTYLQRVDANFCTDSCPGYFKTPLDYTSNANAAVYFNLWTKSFDEADLTNGLAATHFQNCTAAVQQNAVAEFVTARNNAEETKGFKSDVFADYWAFIENEFECTGWCTTTYEKTVLGVPTTFGMYKYLFSGLGRGVPKNIGCLTTIAQWLPPYLNAFGSIAIVVTVLEAIVFALALSLCYSKEKKEVSAKI